MGPAKQINLIMWFALKAAQSRTGSKNDWQGKGKTGQEKPGLGSKASNFTSILPKWLLEFSSLA